MVNSRDTTKFITWSFNCNFLTQNFPYNFQHAKRPSNDFPFSWKMCCDVSEYYLNWLHNFNVKWQTNSQEFIFMVKRYVKILLHRLRLPSKWFESSWRKTDGFFWNFCLGLCDDSLGIRNWEIKRLIEGHLVKGMEESRLKIRENLCKGKVFAFRSRIKSNKISLLHFTHSSYPKNFVLMTLT